MLAAKSAWAVLRAEHDRIRRLLDQVDEVVAAPAAVSVARAQVLADMVDRLQAFDEAVHRPKGALLMSLLKGRSPETDELLARLAATRDRCDGLLAQVREKLRAAANGAAVSADPVPALLAEHRALTLDHLQAEDTLLHSQSAMHLTRDEWAAIASSISDAMASNKN